MILLTLPIYPLKIGLASSLDETQCCEGIGVLLILDSALLHRGYGLRAININPIL